MGQHPPGKPLLLAKYPFLLRFLRRPDDRVEAFNLRGLRPIAGWVLTNILQVMEIQGKSSCFRRRAGLQFRPMKGSRMHPAWFGAVAVLALAPFCAARAADVKSRTRLVSSHVSDPDL